MKRRQPLNLVRWSMWVAVVVAVLGLVALPGVGATPAASAMPSSFAAGGAVTSTAQDWTDLLVGFGLLSAFSLGLMGWWFTRSRLKFK